MGVREIGTHFGLTYHIADTPFGGDVFNGYVAIPEGHPLFGKGWGDESGLTHEEVAGLGRENEYPPIPLFCYLAKEGGTVPIDLAIDVHGGITYSRDHSPYSESDGCWWFGFDCLHGYSPKSDPDMVFVRSQCELLAKQLALWPGFLGEVSQ